MFWEVKEAEIRKAWSSWCVRAFPCRGGERAVWSGGMEESSGGGSSGGLKWLESLGVQRSWSWVAEDDSGEAKVGFPGAEVSK